MTTTVQLPAFWRTKHLTKAELKVVELIVTGLSTKVTAARLNRSPLTVRNQLSEAMRKLNVSSRYELIATLRPNQASVAPAKEPILKEQSSAVDPCAVEYAI